MFTEARKWTETERKAMLEAMPVTMPRKIGEYLSAALADPERFAAILVQFQERARQLLSQEGVISHVAFVFCSRDPKTGEKSNAVYGMEIKGESYSDASKEAMARVMALTAQIGEARCLVMISEAWMCQCSDMVAMQKWRADHNGSLQHHPDTVEVAWMIVETLREHRMYSAPLGKDANGKRTMGRWTRQEADGMEGRFTHLLKPIDYNVS